MNNYSWVTLLSGDNYINGVLGLNYSLQKVNSKYPLHVILSDCSKNTLLVLERNNITYTKIKTESFKDLKGTAFTRTLQKLKIFDLKQYEKVIFLDADNIILQNIDYYFENKDFGFLVITENLPVDRYYGKGKVVIGQCFLISPNKTDISYDYIKERFQYSHMDDEEVLTDLWDENKLPHISICPLTDRMTVNYEKFPEPINPKWFHDNSMQYKKIFFAPNYFEIIDEFQLKLAIPEIFYERSKYYFDEIE